MQRQEVVVLGATGSVGRNALELVARHGQRYALSAISAHSDTDAMRGLIERYAPRRAVMVDEDACARLRDWAQGARVDVDILCGREGLCDVVSDGDVDVVVAAIVGVAGLESILAAAGRPVRILLANKEALVCAGSLLMDTAAAHGAEILPVDSEHSGIFQCLHGDFQADFVRRIVLTASGGPLRTLSERDFSSITPEQACAHPVWSMGPKISVDSATLMNKGLEVIEAAYLFGKSADEIDTVIHPQGVVHALVEFADGNMLAQLSRPDMRAALAVALAWPERLSSGVAPLDLLGAGALEFMQPDYEKFPCLALARAALVKGGDAPASLNAANEVAVAAFLKGSLNFSHIPVVVEAGLAQAEGCSIDNLDDLAAVDLRVRSIAAERMKRLSGGLKVKSSV